MRFSTVFVVGDDSNKVVAELAAYSKKSTISSREIQTAVRLILPGELSKHTISEGTKSVTSECLLCVCRPYGCVLTWAPCGVFFGSCQVDMACCFFFFLCCTSVYSLNLLSPCIAPCFVVLILVNGMESPRRFRQCLC